MGTCLTLCGILCGLVWRHLTPGYPRSEVSMRMPIGWGCPCPVPRPVRRAAIVSDSVCHTCSS